MDVTLKENDRLWRGITPTVGITFLRFMIVTTASVRVYCNVCRPAVLTDGAVSYVDLALDLWVSADGKQTVLDEDEFNDLLLSDSERGKALDALAELQQLFRKQ